MGRRTVRLLPIVAVMLVAGACTSGGGSDLAGSGATEPTGPPPGGTLRVAVPTGAVVGFDLDPQRAYSPEPWELFRCCLLRTLYSYNGKPTEEGGAEARPDLATAMPEVSSDGLTWTFHIRPGLTYGPPFTGTEVVAGDVVRALEREARLPASQGYAFHFSAIRGFDAYRTGSASSIAGLETPDDHTLVVQLDQALGDLAYRFSLPATAPVPEGADQGEHGALLVSTGPYMIEGSELLDPTLSPTEQRPLSGFVPPEVGGGGTVSAPGSLTLVRNPSWEPSTDRLRAAYPDRIEIVIGGEDQEIADRIDSGELDLAFGGSSPPEQVAAYKGDPDLSGRLFVHPNDSIWAVSMNLAAPPFDDVHLRRAVSLAIDKPELVEMISHPPFGPFGNSSGAVATHIAPDALEGGLLQTFDPYPHDPAQAVDEMRRSAYDSDGDGRCDAPECQSVHALVFGSGVVPDQARAIRDDLAPLGIQLDLEIVGVGHFFGRLRDPSQRIPIGIAFGWVKDLPIGSGWFSPLFVAGGLGSVNHTMLGASPGQLRRWGYQVTSVPSVEDRVQACTSLVGQAQTECWAQLDQYLMQEIVPWVPYLETTYSQVVSERVAAYSFDQFTAEPALDRIALVPGSA